MRILVLTKRQYTNKDLIDDRYGRLYELPRELARRGHQLAGLCLSYRPRKEGHLLGPGIDDTMVDWYSVNLGGLILPGLLGYLKKLDILCGTFKPDVIYACSDALHVINGVRTANKYKIPCVVDLYDNFESFALTRMPGILTLFRRAVSSAAGVVTVSSNLQQYIEKHYHPRGLILTVANGIPSGVFHPMDRRKCRVKLGLPVDGKLIGTAGALSSNRGIDVLLEGYKELTEKDPSIHLVLAGPVDSHITLPEGEKIHYLGNLDYQDVPMLFNALNVGVICNLDTSFGRYCFPQKAYEMLACGLPMVAANVGAMTEMFKDNFGFLFIPGNYQSFVKVAKKQLKSPRCLQSVVSNWYDLAGDLECILQETTEN